MSLRGEAQSAGPHRNKTSHSAERGFNAAFELVATPALFGLIGYFIDGWLGTRPAFTVGLSVFVACYVIWKLWYGYNAEMTQLEAELIKARTGGSTGNSLEADSISSSDYNSDSATRVAND